MVERTPDGELMWYCPMLKQKIDESLCVDIYEATYGGLRKGAVPEVKDWDAVKTMCPHCKRFFENDETVRLGD